MFFDLDGFKSYNDAFGHSAGDALLARLGRALAASVAGRGEAYRLGGDEFCVLLDRDDAAPATRSSRAPSRALSEQGEGFTVTASFGVVQIPAEAESSEAALQLADERMYAHKDSRRATEPPPGARRARAGARRARAGAAPPHGRRQRAGGPDRPRARTSSAEELDVLARAAELHDIGKVAVPDDIIHKPGPLDDVEWRIMRQHTLVGERILAAAPALRAVARLVRLSHERWDGAAIPDRLAGEEIPVGARVIAICDTYDAITSERAYAKARSHDEALAELRRCAGTQFDPRVVEAFCTANPVGARARSSPSA